jgi:hypothetical protein
MWDVFIVDEVGMFKANETPMDWMALEFFVGLLDPSLVFFLLPAGGDLVGFLGLLRDS